MKHFCNFFNFVSDKWLPVSLSNNEPETYLTHMSAIILNLQHLNGWGELFVAAILLCAVAASLASVSSR